MIEAIRQIGKWQIEKSEKSDLDVLTKEPKFKAGGKIVFIKIDLDEKAFKGVELEDYDSIKSNRYMFEIGSSKGNKPAPFAQITEPKKTFTKKIKLWFKKCQKSSSGTKENNVIIDNINNVLNAAAKEIVNEVQAVFTEIKKKPKTKQETLFLSLKLNDKYLGDYVIFPKFHEEFTRQKELEISASDKICSMCSIKKSEVFGDNADIIKFATIDKPGFIVGGLSKVHAWRNFPLCRDCRNEIKIGKLVVENKQKGLKQDFVKGLVYSNIPKLIIENKEALDEILTIMTEGKKSISLGKAVIRSITSDKNEILKILGKKDDKLTYNFLFMERKSGSSSAEKISCLIEDVFPSRIKRIFEAKEIVDRMITGDFTFGCLRDFFSKSDEKKRNYDLDKYFLDITDKIFRGVFIDFSFLLRFFMARIRKEFVTDGYFGPIVKNAIMTTIFLENLNLVTLKEVENMEESIFEDVFEKYGNIFTSPLRRGLFLAGVLTQMLLNKQGYERKGDRPFLKKLKGLRMDERDLRSLLPAVQNKLEEYKAFGKSKKLVAEEAYNYLFTSGEKWELSVDEINFYFAGGMNLLSKIKEVLYTKGETDADLEEVDENIQKEE